MRGEGTEMGKELQFKSYSRKRREMKSNRCREERRGGGGRKENDEEERERDQRDTDTD